MVPLEPPKIISLPDVSAGDSKGVAGIATRLGDVLRLVLRTPSHAAPLQKIELFLMYYNLLPKSTNTPPRDVEEDPWSQIRSKVRS
jgi:hypothetical protein